MPPRIRKEKPAAENNWGLPDEKVDDLKKTFAYFDKSGDGLVGTDEIAEVLKRMGSSMTQGELGALIKELDTSGDGEVSWDEFLKCIADRIRNADPYEDLISAFKHFDEKGTGQCDCSFLRHILTEYCDEMTHQEVDDLFEEFDPDNKGYVTYKEMCNMLVNGYRDMNMYNLGV